MKLILPTELVFPFLSVYQLHYCMSLLTKEVLLASLKCFTARSSCTAAIARSEEWLQGVTWNYLVMLTTLRGVEVCCIEE